MNNALLELFRHKTWATVALIEACSTLGADDLSASVPGTYGSIHETLQHLVASDEHYLAAVTGEELTEPSGDELAPLAELAKRTRDAGRRWEEVATDDAAATRELTTWDGWTVLSFVPMAQAIHHADDHRSHVLTTLGARGIELAGLDIGEDLDIWHHAIATGAMNRLEEGAAD